jgi:hypothetical protein
VLSTVATVQASNMTRRANITAQQVVDKWRRDKLARKTEPRVSEDQADIDLDHGGRRKCRNRIERDSCGVDFKAKLS